MVTPPVLPLCMSAQNWLVGVLDQLRVCLTNTEEGAGPMFVVETSPSGLVTVTVCEVVYMVDKR